MINELPHSQDNILGFEVTGKVTLEEEKKWIQRIEDCLRDHETVSILVVLNEKASWGVEAGIEDIKWAVTHLKSIEKIAIVSSSKVWKWLVSIDGFFAPLAGLKEKHFDHADLSHAWEWVKQ